MNHWSRFWGLALVAVVAMTSPLAAQEAGGFQWQGTLMEGKTLEIIGLNGNIEALPAGGRTAEVSAVKKARRSDPAEVRIEVVEHAGGVRICAVYPGQGSAQNDACEGNGGGRDRNEDNDVSVDFTVRVPAGVTFVGRTVNGGVEAAALEGDVRAATVNGKISVTGTGTVEASSVNGSIEASIGQSNWKGALSFETVNGSITVRLPKGVAAEVRAETVNGGLTSDFPLAMTAGERWGPKRIDGTIGAGGGALELETVNGSIEIVRG
ncbi:MAG: hypothetical protein H0W36_02570 [Gemmatimonadetes bacterium]|nr:hypothetical protein [Gemmatimonadota bacterium]